MNVIRYESTDSTQARAAARVAAGKQGDEPTIITAAVQTGGRGRFAREWISPAGGLWFTYIHRLREQREVEGLPLRIGLVGCECLESLAPELAEAGLAIKWPNDILAGGRKLAGVLCQQVTHDGRSFALIGMGINCNHSIAAVAPQPGAAPLRAPVTTLLELTGRSFDLEWLLAHLCHGLRGDLADHAQHGLTESVIQRIEARLAGRGEPIHITLPAGGSASGTLLGLATDGRLRIRTSSGEMLVDGGAEVGGMGDNAPL
ncbi:MAG: biotin--[acetyl-CoA-carboxylase] ligase [Phycisphaerales bacterium]|nr:biotin--[acetyl-CoA-carboxylase] ligase [Phycisphaerales bacterium]